MKCCCGKEKKKAKDCEGRNAQGSIPCAGCALFSTLFSTSFINHVASSNKGEKRESDHFLEILENLEIFEI